MDSPGFYSYSPTRNQRKDNSKTKLASKQQLKSSIPLPAPVQRRDTRSRSTSSCFSQPVYSTHAPLPMIERDKTSLSLSHPPKKTAQTQSKRSSVRPKTASSFKNSYSNIKSKTDSGAPTSTPRLTSQFQHPKLPKNKSKESVDNGAKKTNVDSSDIAPTCESKSSRNDDVTEKKQQLLSLYNEIKKLQPSEEFRPLEVGFLSVIEKSNLCPLEELLKENFILKESSPEFLSNFEKGMEEVFDSWLKLIYDVITSKMTVGKTAFSHLSLPDPSLDLRDEIARFLTNLPTEGEPLHEKLRKIKEGHMQMTTVVMHYTVALSKEQTDLKDENSRLKKTQDQINFQQNEQMAILAQENKELDRKYVLAVEKYNIEKSKTEQQEKNLLSIQKEMLEIKKLLKYNEGRCNDIECRTKKADAAKRTLEVTLRNMELALEKEGKQHRELFEKYSHSEEVIQKLKYELEENKCNTSSLGETNRDLQAELNNLKASLEENQQKRNDLVEDLANKTKKLNEMKEQLDLLKSNFGDDKENLVMTQDYASNLVVKDLTKNVQDKSIQICELKKKHHQMEKVLKEMASREKLLMKQVHDLMKNRTDTDVVLRSQAQELQYRVKDLEKEKADLERILAQKTLELDQRDVMMRNHAKLLQAKDELIPMIKGRKDNDQQCTEKLMAIVYEHYKTNSPGRLDADGCMIGDQNPYRSLESMEKYYGLDPKMVDKELSFRQEKMSEMFNLLEKKQMEIGKLERRIQELQGVYSPGNALEQGQKLNKSRGFFSMFSGTE